MAADDTSREALIERVAKTLHADGGITEDLMPGTCSRCVQSIATATDIVDAVVMPLVEERNRLLREAAVRDEHEVLLAEGKDCPVCTHMTHESAYDELEDAIKRAEAAEAALHAARATRDVFVKAAVRK